MRRTQGSYCRRQRRTNLETDRSQYEEQEPYDHRCIEPRPEHVRVKCADLIEIVERLRPRPAWGGQKSAPQHEATGGVGGSQVGARARTLAHLKHPLRTAVVFDVAPPSPVDVYRQQEGVQRKDLDIGATVASSSQGSGGRQGTGGGRRRRENREAGEHAEREIRQTGGGCAQPDE